MGILIDFLILIRKLKDFRPSDLQKWSSRVKRELNFYNFEILVSGWIFDRFWGQLGSPNQSKINQKLIKKTIKNMINFLINF